MLILLPPSEGKTAPRRGKPLDLATLAFPGLTAAREQVLDALVSFCATDPDKAAEALAVPRIELIARNAALRTAPTARAGRIYTGVLYDHLDVSTLSSAAKRRAATRLAVTSSLFGLVTMADRIPAYRLSGNATLPGIGGVAGVWREHLGGAVQDVWGDGLLVDLRSTLYAAFWRATGELAPRVATVRVLNEVDGRRQVVSHFNKATKGTIVRDLLESGANPRTPGKLASALRDLGWTVEAAAATRNGTRLDVILAR